MFLPTLLFLLTTTLASTIPSLHRRIPGDLNTGFMIPNDTANGVYAVHFSNGAWAHELVVDGANFAFGKNSTGVEPPHSVSEKRKVLFKREWKDPGCGGYDMNHGDTDKANDMLDAQCLHDPKIWPRYNFYSIWGASVAYACNFNYGFSSAHNYELCSPDDRKGASKYITDNCGWYRAGWVSTAWWSGNVWKDALSYGYEGSDKAFCGCGTGGCR